MRLQVNANGSLRRFDCGAICLSLFVGNELEGGPTNLYLRRHGTALECIPLLGPRSPTRFHTDPAARRLIGRGAWHGIGYVITLTLAREAPRWFWHVQLRNTNAWPETLDLTYAQDLALAPYGAIRMNEFYVSQYLDHQPLAGGPYGFMIATRQNQAAEGAHPWCLIGCLGNATSFATDALQLHGLSTRSGEVAVGLAGELPGRRLQHEHAMAILRDAPRRLEPRAMATSGFFGVYVPDHPEASSAADLDLVAPALQLPEARAPDPGEAGHAAAGQAADFTVATLFSAAPVLDSLELDLAALQAHFPAPWRHEERDEHGARLSFFHGDAAHVVMRAKELRVLRPHGHILRTGLHTTPDETALTSTAWMSGVFHSMLTQGHVSINRLLSTVHSYLGLFRSHGQRVFVRLGDAWQLLDVPSAFEMTPEACRWIYRHADGLLEVSVRASHDPQELSLSLQVLRGAPGQFLISHHIAVNGDDGSAPGAVHWRQQGEAIIITPRADTDLGRRFPTGCFQILPAEGTHFQLVGGDELLFLDGRSRQQPFVCVLTGAVRSAGLRIRGQLVTEQTAGVLRARSADELVPRLPMRVPPSSTHRAQLERLGEIAPWLAQNALIHYLAPRGLEQYSGGGWGTRDVCQGPVELLLAQRNFPPLRDLLLRVLANQNPDGDWPQWFMFFERERAIRAGDAHGDVIFWPLLVLAQYLLATADAQLLQTPLPFFAAADDQRCAPASIWQHVERALALMQARVIGGTSLAAYGHGDWNDSLQPADPALREHMCSAWTVTLHFQTLSTLSRALRSIGWDAESARLQSLAEAIRVDFQRLLVIDGVLAGYAIFEQGGAVRYLLHPRDATTGVRYSSLAMIHAILEDLLTPAQVHEHLRLIETQLSGPDGARLFDRPMPYHGGVQRVFQRAETASFFGREIGLMYMHAHLRYAQALAHVGEADRFFHALCQANPLGVRSIVPSATLRQANCYYSSSDAAFADRNQASEQYGRVRQGDVALDGGWRVYSSGAGITVGLLVRRFLGLSCEASIMRLDPVIPGTLDGLTVQTSLWGHCIELHYRIGRSGCGVREIILNGQTLPFTREPNPHRLGAALVAREVLTQLILQRNTLQIALGES